VNINHLIKKIGKAVANSQQDFKSGNIVKIVNCSNTGGLSKNGRTGSVMRVAATQVQVVLHCTHTGGHNVKSIYIKSLDRCVGITQETQWFNKSDVIKIS
jgi:hypothetical protein